MNRRQQIILETLADSGTLLKPLEICEHSGNRITDRYIYVELSRLVARGEVKRRLWNPVRMNGRRGFVFTITDAGRKALSESEPIDDTRHRLVDVIVLWVVVVLLGWMVWGLL